MEMTNPTRSLKEERAARARAARAYANLRQSDLADKLGKATVTVKRMETGKQEISLDDLWQIADLCGVPHDFMTYGFESVPEELKRIHQRFDVLTERMGWTVAEALAGQVHERLTGEPPAPRADADAA